MANVLGQAVAMVGAAMILMRRKSAHTGPQAVGPSPAIPPARPQGIPTLKMPTARGWPEGRTPVAARGLKVNAFATGLVHPRWIEVLPDGGVLAAEALTVAGGRKTAFDHAIHATMRRAAAVGDSPNRITLLRDPDGDGVAEERHAYMEGLNQPFGMALIGDTFYVGHTDALVAYPYVSGATKITDAGKKLGSFPPSGHWTRSLLASKDGQRLYVGVGSLSNIGESGMAAEEGRAAIHEFTLATGARRPFATGLRNPVGLAWEPTRGALWTVVNERDGLGDETPPDYLTEVEDGAFYGWPWCYWGQTVDDRVPPNPAMVARARKPDFALGGHTASLGLCWVPEGTLPGLPAGMAIGQHGSWNRATLAGYRVVLVPFVDGKPKGEPIVLLSGFLSADEKESYGRPVGVALAPGGGLLVADDVGNAIWRITGA